MPVITNTDDDISYYHQITKQLFYQMLIVSGKSSGKLETYIYSIL